ncbi:hypothetical protein HO173_005227 [Letharia columbiana]|uniref:Uncharacterized protein n=1 Tax=Letharia columbiana TaxID=112416 RepID=A0A8H6L5N5_9LECA|nr:uncharacterized protein HO173_005227 [Letharia columbiana]KAF6236446.1 hypothetical protein HO173_005227 [Letharia columbiana]
MNFNCTSDSFWLFAGCEELKHIPLYLAFAAVVAFHMTAGMFESVRPEHQADYARGSHAMFHLEKQGLLATRRTQITWMLAASVVSFFQGWLNSVFLNQCLVWTSETSLWKAPDDTEDRALLKTLSIYLTLLLGFMLFILFILVFSVHWIIVFAGLLTWRPKDLRDEEAGIEMTTHIVDDSSLEVQDRNGDDNLI